MKNKTFRKTWRILSAILCICMLVALLPTTGLTLAGNNDAITEAQSSSGTETATAESGTLESDISTPSSTESTTTTDTTPAEEDTTAAVSSSLSTGSTSADADTLTPAQLAIIADQNRLLNKQTTTTASIYLLYQNTIPTDINKSFAASLFGPGGNDTPYFKVTVDLNKLFCQLDANGNYVYDGNGDTIRDTNIDVLFKTNGNWYISYQSGNTSLTYSQLWAKILLCMSAADSAKFTAYFGTHYVGYVLKGEGTNQTSQHIDGVLTVDPPFYFTEVSYNGSVINTFQQSGVTTTYTNREGTAFSNVKSAYETKLKEVYGDDITITWPSASSMASTYSNQGRSAGTTFTTNGTVTLADETQIGFTLTGNTLDYTSSGTAASWYPNYTTKSTNTYYVATYHMTINTSSVVVTKTFSGVDALPSNYSVTVGGTTKDISAATVSSGTYKWVFTGLTIGSQYTVSENNYNISGVNCSGTVSVNGGTASTGTSAAVTVANGSNTVAFTNEYTTAATDYTVDIPFEKVWSNDNNNADSTRPASVTFQLLNGSTVVRSITLDSSDADADGNWVGTFTNVPHVDADGNKINYTVSEVGSAANYQTAVTQQPDTGVLVSTLGALDVRTATISNPFNIADSNIVWLKKGNQHYVWSPTALTNAEKSQLKYMAATQLTGLGSIQNITYYTGDTCTFTVSGTTVTISKTAGGDRTIAISAASGSSLFYYGKVYSQGAQGGIITNTYTPPYSDLTVTKTFDGITEDMIPLDYTVSVGGTEQDLADATSVSADGLTYTWTFSDMTIGTQYSVSESSYSVDSYNCTSTVSVDSGSAASGTNANITIASGENSVAFRNTYTYQNGQLTITKTIDDKLSYAGDPTFIFKVEIYSDAGLTTKTATRFVALRMTDDSESVTLTDLPRGYYKVTELDTLGYTQDSVTPGDFTVTSGSGSVSTLGYMTADGIGREASVTFANTLNNVNKPIDTDSVSNSYTVSITNGSVSSIQQNTPSAGNDNLDNSVWKAFAAALRS